MDNTFQLSVCCTKEDFSRLIKRYKNRGYIVDCKTYKKHKEKNCEFTLRSVVITNPLICNRMQ